MCRPALELKLCLPTRITDSGLLGCRTVCLVLVGTHFCTFIIHLMASCVY